MPRITHTYKYTLVRETHPLVPTSYFPLYIYIHPTLLHLNHTTIRVKRVYPCPLMVIHTCQQFYNQVQEAGGIQPGAVR